MSDKVEESSKTQAAEGARADPPATESADATEPASGSAEGAEPPAEVGEQTTEAAERAAKAAEQSAEAAQAAEPADSAAEDAPEEVEPEALSSPRPNAKDAPHHPPPPPSLRAEAHGERPIEIKGEPKLARDLMTRKVFTIGPDDRIGGLVEHMEAFHFRHLPIVEGKKLVGVIHLHDLLHASSSFLSERAKERDALIHRTRASKIMHRDVVTVGPEEPLEQVAQIMWQARSQCVAVVEKSDELVGILTEGDFVRLAHHLLSRSKE